MHANSAKTHCKNGHEFTPENTALRHGHQRVCRTCRKRRSLAARAKKPKGAIRRVFEDRRVTWELARPLSDVLAIPYPAAIFDSEDQADGISRLLGQLRRVASRVRPDDQDGHVQSAHDKPTRDEPAGD